MHNIWRLGVPGWRIDGGGPNFREESRDNRLGMINCTGQSTF